MELGADVAHQREKVLARLRQRAERVRHGIEHTTSPRSSARFGFALQIGRIRLEAGGEIGEASP